MKRIVATLVFAGALAGNAIAETQWDLATNYPASAFHIKYIAQFASDVEKATGGSLKIVVHPGGAMIKHAEIKRAVSDGKVAAGEVLISLLADEASVYAIDSIPFLATSYNDARRLYDSQRPYLEKELAKQGLVLLFSVPWPPQGIYAKREITSVDDLKDLKFRTYNVMTRRIAELAGAQPTQIEVPDLPAAFASGRVDVMITSASSGVQTKAEEYLTHYIDSQAWLPRNMVFANKAAFERLTTAEKKALIEAAGAAEDRGWKLSIEEMTIKTKALKDAGIIVVLPSSELQSGIGSASHLCSLLFFHAIDTAVNGVPYKGTAPALNDLMGGHLDFMCDQTLNVLQPSMSGLIKAYAAKTPQRLKVAPDLPTIAESGLPDFQMVVWYAMYAPKGTPTGVVEKLSAALQKSLDDPDVKDRLARSGAETVAPERARPDVLRAYLKSEIDKWVPIIRKAGVQAQ